MGFWNFMNDVTILKGGNIGILYKLCVEYTFFNATSVKQ